MVVEQDFGLQSDFGDVGNDFDVVCAVSVAVQAYGQQNILSVSGQLKISSAGVRRRVRGGGGGVLAGGWGGG